MLTQKDQAELKLRKASEENASMLSELYSKREQVRALQETINRAESSGNTALLQDLYKDEEELIQEIDALRKKLKEHDAYLAKLQRMVDYSMHMC